MTATATSPYTFATDRNAPVMSRAQVVALYALSRTAPAFAIVQGSAGEVVVQAEDGRAWLLPLNGQARRCDELTSPYREHPYPRHPLRDLGCPVEGCPVRMPMLADGALLGGAIRLKGVRGGVHAIQQRGALTCDNHSKVLVEVERPKPPNVEYGFRRGRR